MRYKMFLYRIDEKHNHTEVPIRLGRQLKNNEMEAWPISVPEYLLCFDTSAVLQEIAQTLGELCRVHVHYVWKEKRRLPYLSVVTSYDVIKKVLPKLYAIAEEKQLVLYDLEQDKAFIQTLVDTKFVQVRQREQQIKQAILSEMKPVWFFKKLVEEKKRGKIEVGYIVTLAQVEEKSFLERTEAFYTILEHGLTGDEELSCEDDCFTIKGKQYALTYCLEGYKKHASMMGCYEEGKPCIRPLHRMGTDSAWKWLKSCTELEQTDTNARMKFIEMKDYFPNPADRFVYSIMLTKWLRKEKFSVRYSEIGSHNRKGLTYHGTKRNAAADEAAPQCAKIQETTD